MSLGWHVLEMATHTAVVPDYEDGHVLSTSECWCEPRVTTAGSDGKRWATPLVSHRDLVERNGMGHAITEEAA